MAVQLDPAVKVDFQGNPGIRSFSTLKDVSDFVRNDFNAWEEFWAEVGRIGSLYGKLIQGHRTALEQSLNEISAYENGSTENSISSATFDSIFARYKEHLCIHSESDLGRLALSLLHQDRPSEAAGVIAAATGLLYQGRQELSIDTDWGRMPLRGILKGAALASSVEQGFAGRGKRGAEKLRELAARSDTAIADTKTALSSFEIQSQAMLQALEKERSDFEETVTARLKSADSAFLTLQNAHAAQMTAIEMSFKREMELRAPRTYWRDKAKEHRIGAVCWGLGLAVWALALAGGCIGAGFALLGKNAPITINSTSPATWLLIFGPVVVGLWLMRFINKQATMHLALRQDARERVTLVETYLALYSEDKVRDEQLSLVLQSIFRPSSVTGDDGMQATLIERLVEVLSKPGR